MHKTRHSNLFFVKFISIAVDLFTLSALFALFLWLKKAEDPTLPLEHYINLWPFLFLFWIAFEKAGLYEGVSIRSGACLGPPEEIRRLFYTISCIFIALGCANFCYRPQSYLYSRTVLVSTYIGALFFIPFNRFLFKRACTRIGCWGIPAVIIGSGETAKNTFNNLTLHPEYGLRPIGYFTDNGTQRMPETARFLGTLQQIPETSQALKIEYAILAKDVDIDSPAIQQIIKRYGILFPHLLCIPKSLFYASAAVIPKDLGGTLGLEVRHNLQIPQIYRFKRALDFILTLPCLMIGIPVMGFIAIAIKLDSRGPVFFKHRRITRNGRQINIYKFRTMVNHADRELTALLKTHPQIKEEWMQYGKIQNDPRITRIGAWLRQTSLDELPQLFNVLQGKLTLVGPRPIVKKELAMYGESADLFNRVLPGITGLWQVSGRNRLTYQERAKMDSYYVNNWSIWLDLYILAKTVYAVIFQQGAK